ncbi:hypothetical protein LX32DRAFT_282411 [Colletotrichum zoysiae]|uniref:Uncharacterized protein n=1 Tax=Colletotrichum zoysiae TaxID=1216348 RepID=A0AAD9LWK8_9PEZI|nr:hypothetical protein LX32DRAFT_282411 [Colletotrichum zoysiae]
MIIRFSSSFSFCNNPKIRNIRFNRDSLLLLFDLITCGRYQTAREREEESRDGDGKSAGQKDTRHTNGTQRERMGSGRRGGLGKKKNMTGDLKWRSATLEGRITGEAGGNCAGVRLFLGFFSLAFWFWFTLFLSFFLSKSKFYKTTGTSQQHSTQGHGFLHTCVT